MRRRTAVDSSHTITARPAGSTAMRAWSGIEVAEVCSRSGGPKRRPSVETANCRSGRMSLPSVYQLM